MNGFVEGLRRKIRPGEDSFIECKDVVFSGSRLMRPGKDQFANELAALANGSGGRWFLAADAEDPRLPEGG